MNLALVFLLCAQSQQPMSFNAPEGAKTEDLLATSTALGRRISEYGYKDITVKPSKDGKQIQVFSEAPFNNNVRAKIYQLATIQAKSLELRFIYPLTQAESEQFRPGEAAPKHAKWLKWKGGLVLVRESPQYEINGEVKWLPKKSEGIYDKHVVDAAHLSFSEGTADALYRLPKEIVVKVRLFVDGNMIDLGGNIYPMPKSFKWVIGNLDGWDTLGPSINNPLPLALSR